MKSDFSGIGAKVWVGILVGCLVALLLGLAPGRIFWSFAGVALIIATLVVMLVLELLKRSGQ